MADVITGKSILSGTAQGNWILGASAYDLAIKYQGFRGDVKSWLDSLKAFKLIVSDPTEVEGGIQFTITDEDGTHTYFLPNGKDGRDGIDGINGTDGRDGIDGQDGQDGADITVTNTERLENGNIKVTLSDGTELEILKGDKGDQGDQGIPGREVVLSYDSQGTVWWKYNENDDTLKEVLNLGQLADDKFVETFQDFRFIKFVDVLPDPSEADDKVTYILRREV